MKLGIYGCGGFGREVLQIARSVNRLQKRWEEIIFIDDGKKEEYVSDCRVYTFSDIKEASGLGELETVITIGEPVIKRMIYEKLKKEGIAVTTLIHPSVELPKDTTTGEGTIIYPGAFISCHVSIGCNTVVMPHANIGHDCVIGDHNVICGHANLGGNVTTGENVFIGLSACVKQGISIGGYAVLSMGAVVVHNVENELVVVGNPGRAMARNENHRVLSK